jgi:hypothetical protein
MRLKLKLGLTDQISQSPPPPPSAGDYYSDNAETLRYYFDDAETLGYNTGGT